MRRFSVCLTVALLGLGAIGLGFEANAAPRGGGFSGGHGVSRGHLGFRGSHGGFRSHRGGSHFGAFHRRDGRSFAHVRHRHYFGQRHGFWHRRGFGHRHGFGVGQWPLYAYPAIYGIPAYLHYEHDDGWERSSYAVPTVLDLPVLPGIRSEVAGSPTVYVLNVGHGQPSIRKGSDRHSGPKILSVSPQAPARDDGAAPPRREQRSGPRIVHLRVPHRD